MMTAVECGSTESDGWMVPGRADSSILLRPPAQQDLDLISVS